MVAPRYATPRGMMVILCSGSLSSTSRAAMMSRLGRTEAHIALANPITELPPSLSQFPIEIEQGGTSLCYRGGDGTGRGKAEVAELTKALIAAGIDYTGIDVRESSLEEIFVSLLGEEEAA